MSQPITVVDSFTDTPYSGNPAAVCVLAGAAPVAWMQAVAAEMNVSETAFLVPRGDGDHDLRWFTPTTEVDLCGHATLASAHVLGGVGRFHTRSGVLECRPAAGGTIAMDFPAIPTTPVADPPNWAPALGLPPGRVLAVRTDGGDWTLAEVPSPDDVRAILPDRAAILALGGHTVVAAALAGGAGGADSVCRVFGPGVGIDEDPVTGGAHCLLAPWLGGRLGGVTFVGHQVSARGGVVGMRLAGDRVTLTGRAVTVLQGTLTAGPPAAP
ncbi:MAG TPA: PhzF family phenazine biosynthesis protein [Acidimicrobiales bacterium]|nr:PhzF family phenazine biosynthesis protein [Acidimicrobiales bacterium]